MAQPPPGPSTTAALGGADLLPDDGDLPIDNNWVENRIRPIALGRQNWLFAGSFVRANGLGRDDPHPIGQAQRLDPLRLPSRCAGAAADAAGQQIGELPAATTGGGATQPDATSLVS